MNWRDEMSTVTTASTPATNGSPPSAVDYVRTLKPEEKQAVFLALLREALQFHGDRCLLPVEDENGKMFGYYVPPKASERHFRSLVSSLTPEECDISTRALKDLGRTFEMKTYLDELKREDDARG
jgi:hypothetical protein